MGTTISFRISEDEGRQVKDFVKTNNLNLSSFIRDAIFEKIEDNSGINEAEILKAYKKSFNEESLDHTEVWQKLGI